MKLNTPNVEGLFNNQKSKEEIIDALHRYRKELNFLLMNLDESNMPAIAGRLDGIDGSFSLIDQQLDAITLAVGNAQGDIAALIITAGEISTSVTNLQGDFSTISQTVDGISSTVYNASTGLGAAWSQINQTATEITSIVSWTDVTGYEVASKITQSPSAIDLLANNINITGVVRLISPYSSGIYAEFNNLGDFQLHDSNQPFFGIINEFGGAMSIECFGDSILVYNQTLGRVTAEGTWNFETANVTGLTARFG